jgi:hypothetical protein
VRGALILFGQIILNIKKFSVYFFFYEFGGTLLQLAATVSKEKATLGFLMFVRMIARRDAKHFKTSHDK